MGKTFVILANSRWDSAGIGGNSSQQYATTLMRMGWDVAYVEPSGTWKFKKLYMIKDPKSSILMCDYPYLEYYKEIFYNLVHFGCRSVCRIVDYWKSWESSDIYNYEYFKPELEAKIVKSAERVFALNPLNVERLKSLRPDVELLRNGVDLEHFNRSQWKTKISVPRGRITLGVVASFWVPYWIDLEPLLSYARKHPEDTVNIVGNAYSVLNGRRLPPNMILHGTKHWTEIPTYIHQFDICVVPYNPSTTMYTNPTKVLEYLACGKPVISCYNPSIADYPYVYFYNGIEDFEATVNKALSNPINTDFLINFLKKHTWEERIRTILNCLNFSDDIRDNFQERRSWK